MADFSAERALLLFVLLNTTVFGSAWFFASRRLTSSRSQGLLDAMLLGYLAQYLSVGLPGVLGCLTLSAMAVTASVVSLFLLLAGMTARRLQSPALPGLDRSIVAATGLFVLAFVLIFAHSQANFPVISTDAMTYHFPAAAQWLQQRKIALFPTWFFNPANTYSPLAGSIFIAWMIAPFGGDVVARFVEVPPLLCVGIAMYRLCRLAEARPALAALAAGAAVLARPIFLPSMMGKDDLFVAFFFVSALVALTSDLRGERFAPTRFGIALGLMLATKYTALLGAPVLLLAMDGPRWRARGWITAVVTAGILAGPWYLRNWMLTGNPVFPALSMFTTARSEAFASWSRSTAVLVGGSYGLPAVLAVVLGIAWILTLALARRSVLSNPLHRTIAFGIPLGFALFFLQSPFPEVRFVLPIFLLMFAGTAFVISRLCGNPLGSIIAESAVLVLSLLTVFSLAAFSVDIDFAGISAIVCMVGLSAMGWAKNRPARWALIGMPALMLPGFYSYIHWRAYCREYVATLHDDGSGYAAEYPAMNQLWKFVDENIPPDTTLAYTNLYLVYPLQGPALQRRLVYVPTRPGVKTMADLGWLGRNLPGEKLVPAAIGATVTAADRAVWLANLKRSGAMFLVIGNNPRFPPEEAFAREDARQFQPLFSCPAGSIYAVNPSVDSHTILSPTGGTAR